MNQGASLVSAQNYVESPFIIVKIGNYTFGHCKKPDRPRLNSTFGITYPNYMESLNITKINGAVNIYSLNMVYAITPTDDPNLLEKVFSSISNSRKIYLSYGDWNAPSFIYKEEEAIISTLTTKVNLQNSTITYTVKCTSSALSLTAGVFSFGARTAKPSDVIKELLRNKRYGLTNIFTGMRELTKVALTNLIADDDKTVKLEAKTSISVLDYITYLVNCMVYKGEKSNLKTNCYFWATYDDTKGIYGGTYFKVIRVTANSSSLVSYNTYSLDIGYPSANAVTDFVVNNDDSWSLLYNYTKDIQMPETTYYIDDQGNLIKESADVVTTSKVTHMPSESVRNWWSKMTQFPITASLTIKGLLRPAMLMSYVKINTYFYGKKHTSSGLYIITQQNDTINASGYRTTLSLLRVGGDEHYV